MTDEQIANLLQRTDEQAMHGEGINVTKADVVRLLDERKRLLEAASNVRVSLLMLVETPDDPPTPATLTEYAAMLGAPLAFAEGPAP